MYEDEKEFHNTEQIDLIKSAEQYGKIYLNSNLEGTTFSSEMYLYNVVDMINQKMKNKIQLHACFVEPMCICKNDCDCDYDEYVTITGMDASIGSNCTIILTIKLDEPLNTERDKKLQREYESLDIKIFELDLKTTDETTFFLLIE